MSEKISVVTDSIASLPPDLAKEKNIDVIPAVITFQDESFQDGVDIGMEEFIELLKKSSKLPTTAAPALGDYITVYKKHPGNIISVHLGSGFSAIFSSAEAAGKEVGERVHPFDTGSVSLGVGFMAIKAADLAIQGATVEQILAELEDMRGRTTIMAALDTLDNLEKGGRVSHAKNLFGSLIQIKPILEIKNNKIYPIEKPRTRKKSLKRLIELTENLGPLEQVAVLHADSPLEANGIVEQIKRFHPGEIILGNIGPALTTHGGPGIVGVAAVRKK